MYLALDRWQRESLIRTANARASQNGPAASKEDARETSPDNALDVPVIYSELTTWRDSHDDLQKQIADKYVEHSDDDSEVPPTPQHHDSSDESVGTGQDPAASAPYNPSMSFVSSFTSSFSTDTTRPKRSRQSLSSPTQSIRSSKSRSRPTASQGFIQPSSSTTE